MNCFTYMKDPESDNKLLLKAGEDFYIENGLLVFTALYHSKRGYCCKNGCRHCPFDSKTKLDHPKKN
jgi:hypothetical protein